MRNSGKPKKLELLAPARDADIAIEAIKHGADAVYMGPPSHGARKAASNSLDEIRRVVDFAHVFHAKVYCTVNTIIYDKEIKEVEKMISDLWRIGVDALIVQDMGILRMNIPPIPLHASTQCDIRTVEKAKFLQEVGFSQLVLARELSIREIEEICTAITVPVETFVHGALCTGFSGRCQAGYAVAGRSGNRGECPQICRLPFTLRDNSARILAENKYLLSLKDLNASDYLFDLINAGVSSFKIEGRLKDMEYVKNVVSAYSQNLDSIIEKSNGQYERSSFGKVKISFVPDLNKSFNRGFTSYRLSGDIDYKGIASADTPKSMGEKIDDISLLHPGDGISWTNKRGEYEGTTINAIKGNKIIGNRPFILPKGVQIRRTSNIQWKKLMAAPTAERRVAVDVIFDDKGITAIDETAAKARIINSITPQKAIVPQDYRKIFSKLGNTAYQLRNFENKVPDLFYPASAVTELRRSLIEALSRAKKASYPLEFRRKEEKDISYPSQSLTSSDNVSNRLAESFYKSHGVREIQSALEIKGQFSGKSNIVMSTKHCIFRELGQCKKKGCNIEGPLTLENGNLRFAIETDCSRCEMHLRKL